MRIRRAGIAADRRTAVLGAIAAVTVAGVVVGEVGRVWRRGSAPLPGETQDVLSAAEEAVAETAQVAVAGYREVSERVSQLRFDDIFAGKTDIEPAHPFNHPLHPVHHHAKRSGVILFLIGEFVLKAHLLIVVGFKQANCVLDERVPADLEVLEIIVQLLEPRLGNIVDQQLFEVGPHVRLVKRVDTVSQGLGVRVVLGGIQMPAGE